MTMLKKTLQKACRGVGVIKKLSNDVPKNALLTIYKSFVRPNLDYGDIFYHQSNNEDINSKVESEPISSLESLRSRRTFMRLCSFHKIIFTGLPSYLFNLISKSIHGYPARTSGNIPTYQCRTDTLKQSFFPWTIFTWNKIHPETGNASLAVFKKLLLKETRPITHLVYNICNPNGLKPLTRLRLGLSHLN